MCIWLWNLLIPRDLRIDHSEKLLETKCQRGITILNSSYRGIMTIKDNDCIMHSYYYYTQILSKPISRTCCICLQNPANIKFYPCIHRDCCDECMLKHFMYTASRDITPFCPMCKTPIEQFTRLIAPSFHYGKDSSTLKVKVE